MKIRLGARPKFELLPNKRGVVSPRGLLSLIEKQPEKIDEIKFINPKLGSKSLGKFIVEYEW